MKKVKKLLSASILAMIAAIINPALGAAVFGLSILFGGGGATGFAFASIFDASALTLDREGVKATSELIYTAKFASPAWNEFMDIETGIKHDKQIVLIGHFNGLAGAVRSACDITPNPDSIPSSEKTWSPKYISDRFEECFDNLQTTFWKYVLANGLNKEDLTQSDYEGFVLKLISEYMNDDMMYRLLFFTDTAITSGGTNNIAAGKLKYFNMLDGIFKQLETIVTTTPARRVTITENQGATYLLQKFAAASPTVHPVTDYLEQVTTVNASMELRGVSDPVLMVSQSVVDQYASERKKAGSNTELEYTRTESGIKTFEFNGITVVPIPTWDRLLKRHFDNGTVVLNPHRILYTSKSNIRVGVEETSNLSELTAKYNDYHKKFFSDFGFNLDVKVVDDNLVVYGY